MIPAGAQWVFSCAHGWNLQLAAWHTKGERIKVFERFPVLADRRAACPAVSS